MMKRKEERLHSIFPILLLVAALASGASLAGTVEISVTNDDHHATPAAHVLVYIDEVFVGVTDSDGKFLFDVAPGKNTFVRVITKDKDAGNYREVLVGQNEVLALELILKTTGSMKPNILRVHPEHQGKVDADFQELILTFEDKFNKGVFFELDRLYEVKLSSSPDALKSDIVTEHFRIQGSAHIVCTDVPAVRKIIAAFPGPIMIDVYATTSSMDNLFGNETIEIE
jgi:hypothetical protein